MNQLKDLMNAIVVSNKDKVFKTCSQLLENSEYFALVKQYLLHLGFNVSKMSLDDISILFFGLLDILIVIKDDNYYFATLSASVVDNLRIEGRLLSRDDEDMYFDKTFKLIQGQTFESINKYLEGGKFKFIKLSQETSCSHTNFICRASIMNPYPDLKGCKVYPLTEVSIKFNNLVNNLILGVLTLSTEDGDVNVTCLPKFTNNRKLNYTCTSCNIYCKSLDFSLVEIPFWKIKDYRLYEPNSIVAHLLTGIYRVKKKSDTKSTGTLITMNREILRKFYGDKYLRLESLGVRQRYAYEDMLSIGFKPYDISFYYNNYYFYLDTEMRGIGSYTELRDYLRNVLDKTNSSQYNGFIHPRVLGSYSSILNKHCSFYLTIKDFDDYIFEEVNPDDILPKLYYVSGITSDYGYKVVQIESPFESGVENSGKDEIVRQCGDLLKIVSVYCVKTDTYLKGKSIYSFGSDCQVGLLNTLRVLGYSKGFDSYAPKVREICLAENITYNVSDDSIKYLFANSLARKNSNVNKLTLSELAECLIEFLDLLKYNKIDSTLDEELRKIAKSKLKKCYIDINRVIQSGGSLDSISSRYTLVPTEKDYQVQTSDGVLTLRVEKDNKLVLLQTASIKHGDKDLGTVRFPASF